MDTALILFLGLIWYVVGIASFIWHWTSEFDFTVRNIPMAGVIGFTGPIAFIIRFIVHPRGTGKLISKRS